MGVITRAKRIVLGGTEDPGAGDAEADDREPTHVCESCGEEYHIDREGETEIPECRACGGVRVTQA